MMKSKSYSTGQSLFYGYLSATTGVAAATVVFALLRSYVSESVVAMLYLFVVVLSATGAGLGAAIWAAILGFTCWNFFFVHPVGTFYIAETRTLLALLSFLGIGMMTGKLAAGARKRAMEAAEASAQLEAERLKASLLSSISHDLRTPLASIKAAATSIGADDAITDEEQRKTLAQSIAHNADRLDNFVSNLLDISRLEAGAWKPAKEPYPFIEILGTTLSRLTDEEAARVELHIPRDLPVIPLDELQMQQVLWNLIENALKYSPSGTPLELYARARDAMLEVRLKDHGHGIPAGEEENIFRKFYRVPNHHNGGYPGVGIGLTICKQIVEAHGGELKAENAPDGGAVFTFTLPLHEEKNTGRSAT